MTDAANGTRRSTIDEAALLLSELMHREVRTLAFVRSRQGAELLTVRAKAKLAEHGPDVAGNLATYRGSYLPEDRRRVERDLFEGRLTALAATSAMELGIDVGDLDATVLTGYPGSVASTWQQAGRSGRRGDRALSVLVAQDDPLDQYLMRHPDSFFRAGPRERANISREPLRPEAAAAVRRLRGAPDRRRRRAVRPGPPRAGGGAGGGRLPADTQGPPAPRGPRRVPGGRGRHQVELGRLLHARRRPVRRGAGDGRRGDGLHAAIPRRRLHAPGGRLPGRGARPGDADGLRAAGRTFPTTPKRGT